MHDSPDSTTEGMTLALSIAQRLREDVLAGRYLPGAKIRLEDIRQAFGVSWSPIREAVTRLVSEGLMIADSQKGYRVAPATRAELEETIRLRVLLEPQALRLAIALGNDAWEAQVLSAHHRLGKLRKRSSGKPGTRPFTPRSPSRASQPSCCSSASNSTRFRIDTAASFLPNTMSTGTLPPNIA